MITSDLLISKSKYRNVFFVQNREYWNACPFEYNKDQDIVLSFDFAVVHMMRSKGGEAQYIDHIVNSELLESYNYKTYEFLAAWHYNAEGHDIFSYKEIEVGSAFRIEILSDITYYIRLFVSLCELLKKNEFATIYVGIDDVFLLSIIDFLNIKTIKWSKNKHIYANICEYTYPIFDLFEKALRPSTVKYKTKVSVIRAIDKVSSLFEKLKSQTRKKKYVHIEHYFPTKDIIRLLKKDNNIRMVRSDFYSIADLFSGVHLPVFVSSNSDHHNFETTKILEKFEKEKCSLFYVNDFDISKELYRLILKRISPVLPSVLEMIDNMIKFLSNKNLCLMITFASIGVINRLMINYCKKNDITIYMVINGLLANSFLDEAKDGTWINSYGDSVRKKYFKGMDNVVCLGDPRMDKYAKYTVKKKINYTKPVIGIGASLFSNVDLNSYLAVEFDFLNDIMVACERLKDKGREMDIIIKLRLNSYVEQYESFLDEYFSDISVKLLKNVPMTEVFDKVDLYISLASQTLFEASSLGIPVIYYKNDTHYYHTPFDGASELVTAFTQDDLVNKIEAFYNRDKMYDAFKEKANMEKYIGPLDGQNLKRNMDFIYSLMQLN